MCTTVVLYILFRECSRLQRVHFREIGSFHCMRVIVNTYVCTLVVGMRGISNCVSVLHVGCVHTYIHTYSVRMSVSCTYMTYMLGCTVYVRISEHVSIVYVCRYCIP